MPLVQLPEGFYWPFGPRVPDTTLVATQNLSTTGHKFAFCGHIRIDGRPVGAKTISSAGGKLHFMAAGIGFVDLASTFDFGIQDVSASGPPIQPDGTFDVKATLVGGGGVFTTTAWNQIPMTTGSKSITNGDTLNITTMTVAMTPLAA